MVALSPWCINQLTMGKSKVPANQVSIISESSSHPDINSQKQPYHNFASLVDNLLEADKNLSMKNLKKGLTMCPTYSHLLKPIPFPRPQYPSFPFLSTHLPSYLPRTFSSIAPSILFPQKFFPGILETSQVPHFLSSRSQPLFTPPRKQQGQPSDLFKVTPVLPSPGPVASAHQSDNVPTPVSAITQLKLDEDSDSDSVSNLSDSPFEVSSGKKARSLLGPNAYKRRNVYKSIIRHMFSYIRQNRKEIIEFLTAFGFTLHEIEHAFFKVNYYNDMEREKGNPKRAQAMIKKIITHKSIFSYILREALHCMIRNWSEGKYGKISRENAEIYLDVCNKYYDELVTLIGKPAEGRGTLV